MKTVLITGCANGIGKHLALRFYEKGYFCLLTDIDLATVQSQTQTWDSARFTALKLDVRDTEAWQAIAQKFTKIDILINNAGVIIPEFLKEMAVKAIDFQIDINLKGMMYGTAIIGQKMIAQQCGHIINIASLAGVAPIHGLGVYAASKHGVRGFTLSVAHELKQKGIKISCICPDLVNTDMLTQQLDHKAAALTFSGNKKALSVQDIEKAIFERALTNNELEICVPKHRGWLGKIANLFPERNAWLVDLLYKKGLKQQKAMKV
jgi:3-oxoacyl-[acyl-carrier protein] reductase